MKRVIGLGAVLFGVALAQDASSSPPLSVAVPREKISLACSDTYFKTERTDYVLQDEAYPSCTLRLPLALKERWKGERRFYIIPRVSANLFVKDDKGVGRWLPLSPLVNPGQDPLHRVIESKGYEQVELVGQFKKLSDVAGTRTPDTVGAGGKLSVCVSPVRDGEVPCVTFDVTARFKVYKR